MTTDSMVSEKASALEAQGSPLLLQGVGAEHAVCWGANARRRAGPVTVPDRRVAASNRLAKTCIGRQD